MVAHTGLGEDQNKFQANQQKTQNFSKRRGLSRHASDISAP